MKSLVTIIIPVYNAERWLCRCLNSVINQTYQNLEIILINDGSLDGSANICDEYATKDHRIRVIHQKNCGVSASRQKGIDYATGEYLIHVDSDDWVDKDMIAQLYSKAIEGNYDMVICDYYEEFNRKTNYCCQNPNTTDTQSLLHKLNFNNTTGIFNCILWSKLLAVLLLAVSCLGTHGVKGEKITWPKIYAVLVAGCALFFLSWWLLKLPLPHMANTAFYIFTLTAGYLALLMSGLWMSRLYRHNLMEDVFNMENESFMQETRLMENEYSVNLPTRFYYKKRWNNGFVNIVNIFRACMVIGTPGSGKSYAIVNSYIRQLIAKGFAIYIYDYKFDDLSTIAYNSLLKNMDKYEVKPRFYVINFDDPRRSHRCNPINPEFMTDISDAYEASYTIMLNLNRTWV